MPKIKKRPYNSTNRNTKALQTRTRILSFARNLFDYEGFECVTIEKIAKAAKVSTPTVYSLFQSKLGILRALMDEALPLNEFQDLVEKSVNEKCPKERLRISAQIARQIYDAEKAQMDIFRGATVLAPEFKELEQEKEMCRYNRQQVTIQSMITENSLSEKLNESKARDILWTFTGRDMYRMLVTERKWSSNEYEKWLGDLLIQALLPSSAPKI